MAIQQVVKRLHGHRYLIELGYLYPPFKFIQKIITKKVPFLHRNGTFHLLTFLLFRIECMIFDYSSLTETIKSGFTCFIKKS